MTDEDLLGLDSQLCFLLHSSARAITGLYRPLLGELGLTYPQYLVMLVLWEAKRKGQDALAVGELGCRLYLDTGTLTPLLKRLEKAGQVTRKRRGTDERVVEIRLTEAGASLEEKAKQIPEALLCMAGSDMARLSHLREELRSLLSRIQQVARGDGADGLTGDQS